MHCPSVCDFRPHVVENGESVVIHVKIVVVVVVVVDDVVDVASLFSGICIIHGDIVFCVLRVSAVPWGFVTPGNAVHFHDAIQVAQPALATTDDGSGATYHDQRVSAAVHAASRISSTCPPSSQPFADAKRCAVDNKRVIFDVTIDRVVMRHRYQTCTHLSLSTACEKGGQWALVSLGRIMPGASASSSSLTTAPASSSSSCNLSCTSHALVGEHLQRACRLQTVLIANGRRYNLGFCQFRLDHIALEHKRLIQWHMRGGEGLSTLVSVAKFVHCQSFIHVTLSIGSASDCVRGVPNPLPVPEHVSPPISARNARTRAGLHPFKKRHGPPKPPNQQSHSERQREETTQGGSAADSKKHIGLRSSWKSVKQKLHVAKRSQEEVRQRRRRHEGSLQPESGNGGRSERASVYFVKFPDDDGRSGG